MSNFYKDKKVIVTGGAGFVGSHLVDELLAEGAHVIVIDDHSRGQNTNEQVEILNISIQHPNEVHSMNIFRDAFAIFNLAATVAGVLFNQSHHTYMFRKNVELLRLVVQTAELCHVPHFLQVSSACVYGEGYTSPCDDAEELIGEPTKANSGYAHAKRMGEKFIEWSNLEHAVIVRPSNIYGPRDYFDQETAHVIPALIRKCIEDDEVEVYGTGQEIREFLYVKDVAKGIMRVLEHGEHKETYNLGTDGWGGATARIEQLVKMIMTILDVDKPIKFSNKFDSGDNERWSCANKLANLGWQCETNLLEGLERTIKWYLNMLK